VHGNLQTLRGRLRQLRDKAFANPRFQRFVLANPLTRPFARRRARALFDLCAGFVYAQVLFACVRLRLFDLLRDGPLEIEELAEKLALSSGAARRLLEAATALALTQRRGKARYGLGPLGAALVGNPAALAVIEHQPLLYADLADPVALLRGEVETTLSRYWPYSAGERTKALASSEVAAYSALMAATQPLWAQEALAVYPIWKHRRLLDVGGGEGVFLCEAAKKAPALELMLFDLPAVAERARTRLAEAGLAQRAKIFSGDFLRDPLPQGADVISLVRIVHDHDDASALTLLRNVRAALPSGGTVLVIEALSGEKGFERLNAYYGFYTLAMGRGEPRTFETLAALLRAAGFASPKLIPTLLPATTGLIVARAT
jgi:demethylspheroidene O-methyltransferase